MQQVEETLAEADMLRSRVRRECVECHNAGGWGEGEEGAVEPAAWGGFYRGAVISVCVGRVQGRGASNTEWKARSGSEVMTRAPSWKQGLVGLSMVRISWI